MKTRSRRIQLHAWMATAQQCKKKTQPVWKRLAHEAKRDMMLKYRTVSGARGPIAIATP